MVVLIQVALESNQMRCSVVFQVLVFAENVNALTTKNLFILRLKGLNVLE